MVKSKEALFFIGLYLIADGWVSIMHFGSGATQTETLFRYVRMAIGILLMMRGGK